MVCVVRTVLLSFAVERASLKASITSGSTNPKIPAGFAGIADLLSVLEHSKFALNVEFFVRHQHFLHPKLGNLQEVSRGSVHIYNRCSYIPVDSARRACVHSFRHRPGVHS